MEHEGTWDRLKGNLEKRLSPQVCATWISQTRCLDETDKVLKLGLPDAFSLNWVRDHYADVFEEELRSFSSKTIAFAIDGSGRPAPAVTTGRAETPLETPREAPPSALDPRLNERYLFDNFVVGPSNELGWTAAKQVADSRVPPYNPLVIVGGVGLGKTHLLHAIGHVASRRRPSIKIRLKTSEEFINDVLGGIRSHSMAQVRQMYRSCDLLLIDDIQFIAKAPTCQEEFFHTFNALYDAQKQIVVTSDRLPHHTPDIEERVRSRFAWGLIADLKVPELKTRIAIVQAKARHQGIEFDEEVATFMAQSVRSNMREMEGCITRVNAMASLRKSAITVALAKEALKGIISEKGQALTCDQILRAVAGHFEVTLSDIKSAKRARDIAFPRQISMFLCRRHTSASYPEIGNAHGGKDHTTAINAFKRIGSRLNDPDVRSHIEDIERLLLD